MLKQFLFILINIADNIDNINLILNVYKYDYYIMIILLIKFNSNNVKDDLHYTVSPSWPRFLRIEQSRMRRECAR